MSHLVSCGFPRSNRLLTPEEYRKVFEKPFRVHTRFFTLLIRETELATARLGIAVAKKNIKLAVSRNIIKRQIRESFRCGTPGISGVDIVILAKKEAGLVEQHMLAEDLGKQWKQLGKHLKRSSSASSRDTKSS